MDVLSDISAGRAASLAASFFGDVYSERSPIGASPQKDDVKTRESCGKFCAAIVRKFPPPLSPLCC